MRLLLISLDAAYREDAGTLLKLPAFSELTARGVFCDCVKTIYPTLTYPIHTSILTGCYPDRHGIGHNQPFQPDVPPSMRSWHWDAREIRVATLHTAAHEKGLSVASLLWPVSGKSHAIKRNLPEVLALPNENQTLKIFRYGSALWLLGTELRYGRRRISPSQPYLDNYAALLCEKLIEKHTPDIITLHLTNLDSVRHHFGTHSPEASDALTGLDRCVGRIVSAAGKAGILNDMIIAVVSDHGQADVSRGIPLDELLRKEAPARAQQTGMGAFVYAREADLSGVAETLKKNTEVWGISHIYGEAELRAIHAPADVHLAVDAMENVTFTDGETVQPYRANHGFGLSHIGAQCLLWLAGGPFKKGCRIKSADIVDVAPTLARAMNLRLPDAQGRILAEAFL